MLSFQYNVRRNKGYAMIIGKVNEIKILGNTLRRKVKPYEKRHEPEHTTYSRRCAT